MTDLSEISPASCADALKTLADGTRLAVLRLLMQGTCRVGELGEALQIDQSLLSHHLQVLRRAGMVLATRVGKGVEYRLAPGVRPSDGGVALNLGCCELTFPKEEQADGVV